MLLYYEFRIVTTNITVYFYFFIFRLILVTDQQIDDASCWIIYST